MNIKKIISFILCTLIIANIMFAEPINAPVETYFLPEDTKTLNETLNKLLDNAQKEIVVAMYWLTDQNIINKLIRLHQKGIDIDIIFDESAKNAEQLLQNFLQHDIIPLVSPQINGAMHNKFLVIDEKIVLTGSANFTKTVLDPSLDYFNNENVLIVYSEDIAKKYLDEFSNIKSEIAGIYIDILANESPNQIPEWIKKITRILYEKDPEFENFIKEAFSELKFEERRKIKQYFPHIENISTSQKDFLKGIIENSENLSYAQADFEIEKFNKAVEEMDPQSQTKRNVENIALQPVQKQEEKFPEISEPPQQWQPPKKASLKQINYIIRLGYPPELTHNLTQKQVGGIIAKLNKRQTPY